jgi:hypothetical protein
LIKYLLSIYESNTCFLTVIFCMFKKFTFSTFPDFLLFTRFSWLREIKLAVYGKHFLRTRRSTLNLSLANVLHLIIFSIRSTFCISPAFLNFCLKSPAFFFLLYVKLQVGTQSRCAGKHPFAVKLYSANILRIED